MSAGICWYPWTQDPGPGETVGVTGVLARQTLKGRCLGKPVSAENVVMVLRWNPSDAKLNGDDSLLARTAVPHHLRSVSPRTFSPNRSSARRDNHGVPGFHRLDARPAVRKSDAGLDALLAYRS